MERYIKALIKTSSSLLRKKNVVGVGVGLKKSGQERTKRPALIVFVEKKIAPGEMDKNHLVPRKVEGLETDVVEIGRVRLLNSATVRERPAKPGMSIGHYKVTAGTFGAVVKDVATGERLILSNNHVLANGTDGRDGLGNIGDPIYQPGVYDGGKESDHIANLYKFLPIMKSIQSNTECPIAAGLTRKGNSLLKLVKPNYQLQLLKKYSGTNLVDAALARPLSPDMVRESVLGIGLVEGVTSAELNMMVQKSGRTTGITRGEVTALGATLQVDMGNTESAWFSDQVVTEMKSQGGDSGSLVLDEARRAVGLLFAGSESHTIVNRIENVMDRLGVKL